MTITTSLPLPAGIYWQAIITREFNLAVAPGMGASLAPFAHYFLVVEPELWSRPPLRFRLRAATRMSAKAGTMQSAAVNLAVAPKMSPNASRSYKASIILSVTPSMSYRAALLPKAPIQQQINTSVHRASRW